MSEAASKSMIYGNVKKNSYGRFIPICAPISEEGRPLMMQLKSRPYWITLTKQKCSETTIEKHTLIE